MFILVQPMSVMTFFNAIIVSVIGAFIGLIIVFAVCALAIIIWDLIFRFLNDRKDKKNAKLAASESENIKEKLSSQHEVAHIVDRSLAQADVVVPVKLPPMETFVKTFESFPGIVMETCSVCGEKHPCICNIENGTYVCAYCKYAELKILTFSLHQMNRT